MLYIHKLIDLNRRVADSECIPLVREFKEKIWTPLSYGQIDTYFKDCLITEESITQMEETLFLVNMTLEKVQKLLNERNPLYEPISIQRTIKLLQTIPLALQNNILFAQEMKLWFPTMLLEATQIFNQIKTVPSRETGVQLNSRLSRLFERLLRNNDFKFKYEDLIYENHVEAANGLVESMGKGFFFHVTLEEEIKKLSFQQIKGRIPKDELNLVSELEKDIQSLCRGVKVAYEFNHKIVQASVILYSGVKWAMG
ncbi:MAG TPA: hypothetical protein VJC39_01485 [Candidatus Nanoarchaeia archaeon]|nr:hypothetical protein [Candidatus Nanoarchaeia archaeon]